MTAMWIAAAGAVYGSAPHFHTQGSSVTGLAAVMAFFFAWAIVVDVFSKAAERRV
jgi:hypothetical protein